MRLLRVGGNLMVPKLFKYTYLSKYVGVFIVWREVFTLIVVNEANEIMYEDT